MARDPSEIKVHGFHAAMAVFRHRPSDIVRTFVVEDRVKAASPLLKWSAAHKRPYHVVSDAELANITATSHHEGLVVVAKRHPTLSWDEFKEPLIPAARSLRGPEVLIYLDGVGNPHNLGSIMRTAAHFGVRCILGPESLPHLSPAIYRVAEGAAEVVRLVKLDEPLKRLGELLECGFKLMGTSSHKGEALFTSKLPSRLILILGAEGQGMSPAMSSKVSGFVKIPGTGMVESLNVSVAAALLMGEFHRQHAATAKKPLRSK